MNASRKFKKLKLKSLKFREKINFADSRLKRGKRWEIYGWRQWVPNIMTRSATKTHWQCDLYSLYLWPRVFVTVLNVL